jgi:hypothetical protein
MFGEMPIPNPQGDQPVTVNRVLETLGLDNLGALVGRSGYKGRALWSQTTLEAPGPKRGLLALADQPSIRMEDLPPLPFGVNGFYATGLDWSKLYDTLTQLSRDVAALGPPDAAAQVEGLIAAAPQILGFDPKTDLFDTLGNVTCVYGDTRQGFFGMGTGVVIEVKDAEKLRTTLDHILTMAVERSEGNASVRRSNKQGRDIYVMQVAGVSSLSFAVDDGWLVLGMLPQTVEAFLLRVDQKLTNWTPTPSYQTGLAALPQEFSSIRSTDPRKTYRTLIGLAPVLMSFAETGIRQSGMFPPTFELPLSLADIPPAEQFARPLFPNLTTSTIDDEGIHCTSRTSLPSIPLIGEMGGGSTIAVSAIGVALLLPAVQQAREAARRTQSKNNLKQIGFALHNFHDVHGNFPQGTHPNDKLKPEERLSWLADILPFVEQAPLFNQINFDKGWKDKDNEKWMKSGVAVFQHPSVPEAPTTDEGFAVTHYVGIAGVGKDAPFLKNDDKKAGIFGYNRVTRMADIRDGTSNTVAVSEASKDFGPWGAGGKATIRGLTEQPYINGPDGIGGPSPGGAHFLFADGAVRFISENIDPTVMEALSTKSGGEVIGNIP